MFIPKCVVSFIKTFGSSDNLYICKMYAYACVKVKTKSACVIMTFHQNNSGNQLSQYIWESIIFAIPNALWALGSPRAGMGLLLCWTSQVCIPLSAHAGIQGEAWLGLIGLCWLTH